MHRAVPALTTPLLAALLWTAAVAAPEPEAPPAGAAEPKAPPTLTTPFLGPDGQVRLLLRPEFRDAPGLLADLQAFGVPDLGIGLAGPLVQGPDPKRPPIPSRLVLEGAPEVVAQARQVLAYLDVPLPSALVSLLAVEVDCQRQDEAGGSLLFDRDTVPTAPATLFRGLASQFEPDSYLRSSLLGVRPFPGTSLAFGNPPLGVLRDGAFEYVLRLLADRGEAEVLTWPTVVCTEGVPGAVTSLVEIEDVTVRQTLTQRGVAGRQIASTRQPFTTGVVFQVLADRIGTDALSLQLDATFRFALPDATDPAAAGTLKIRERQVQTALTLHDGETVLIGGLRIRRRLDAVRGLPVVGGLPGLSARSDACVETELVLLLRARVLNPGQSGGLVVPPGEARRLERLERKRKELDLPLRDPWDPQTRDR